MFHQRGEPGLFAVQEASDECLLKEVHKVDRLEQAAQLLCRLEGSFKIHFHFPVQEVYLFPVFDFLPQTNTYKSNLVDLGPCARLFPQTNVDSCTMVHLWPKVSNT